jgi:hypothetical protein
MTIKTGNWYIGIKHVLYELTVLAVILFSLLFVAMVQTVNGGPQTYQLVHKSILKSQSIFSFKIHKLSQI